MWFIAHTGTMGSETVVSLDFDRALDELPPLEREQSDEEEDDELCELASVASERTPPPPPPPSVNPSPVTEYASTASTPAPPPSPVKWKLRSAPNLTSRVRLKHTLLSDSVIVKWVDVYGPTWRALSASLGGRPHGWSDDVVRNRYIRILKACGGSYERRVHRVSPKLPTDKVAWRLEDDAFLADCVLKHGTRWKDIKSEFDSRGLRRTQQAIRNRANRLLLVRQRDNTVLAGDDEHDCAEE